MDAPMRLYSPDADLREIVREPAKTLDRIAAETLRRCPPETVDLRGEYPPTLYESRWVGADPGSPALVARLWALGDLPESGCGRCDVCSAIPVGHGVEMCVVEEWDGDDAASGPIAPEPVGDLPDRAIPVGKAAHPPHWAYEFGGGRPGKPWAVFRSWRAHLLPGSGCGLCAVCHASTTSYEIKSCVVAYREVTSPSSRPGA
jgi:hypothetical protein